MGKTVATAMRYEKTAIIGSKRKTIEQGYFKEMTTANIIFGALKELYRRYSTEVWAFCTFTLLAVEVYQHI